jgi:cytochrome P450
LNRSFSPSAIEGAENLIVESVKALCEAFSRQDQAGKSSNLLYAFRCMAMDTITTFCFGKPIYAVDAPGFEAPIVMAMDASMPVFVGFKHSELFKNMIMKCPPKLSRILSPETSGLIDLQQLLRQQISELTNDPEKLKALPHNMTIYHRLMDADAYRDKKMPSAGSLYEEGQALMFGGADTVGNTLMVGTYHLLRHPEIMQKLKQEVHTAWPSLSGPEPKVRNLESLPYLNAVIKESLRLSSGVISGLLRIVPPTGANIVGVAVPAGVG